MFSQNEYGKSTAAVECRESGKDVTRRRIKSNRRADWRDGKAD